MDGIHDLGGMHGFGLIVREENEPAFHHHWEATVRAMQMATVSRGIVNLDETRWAVERIEPAHYLGSSYYEHWLDGTTRSLLEKNVIDEAELDARTEFFLNHPDATAMDALHGPLPETTPIVINRLPPPRKYETNEPPRFKKGDRVITANIHPQGHTRLPRYVRSKRGIVYDLQGIQVFPDTNAHRLGENPQPVYTVEFAAAELWGPQAEPNERLYIDLWESYLEPA
jgi:nitrile hydratase